jgi:hypothetical protein
LDDDTEEIAIQNPPINPYVTPPTTPEKQRQLVRSSPVVTTPTTVGRLLQQASTDTVIPATPEKLGTCSASVGYRFLFDEYSRFHQSRVTRDPNVKPLGENEIRVFVNRVMHAANLLILTPPPDAARYSSEHTRILSLIFARKKRYLSSSTLLTI